MKLFRAVLVCITLTTGVAVAHTELSQPAIGFVYLNNLDADNSANNSKPWSANTATVQEGILLYGEMGTVPLIAFDYIQLKSAYFGYKRQYMAYVFEQQSERYRIRTDESQFLWVQKKDTSGFVSLENLLLGSCIYLDILTAEKIVVGMEPGNELSSIDSWKEVIEERIFTINEFQEVDGNIWVRIKPKWYEPWHLNANTNIELNAPVFNQSRWALAHNIDGLNAFTVFGAGDDCD